MESCRVSKEGNLRIFCLIGKMHQTHTQTNKQTNKHIHKQTNKQTNTHKQWSHSSTWKVAASEKVLRLDLATNGFTVKNVEEEKQIRFHFLAVKCFKNCD
jgi:hypothetical protein